MLAPLLALIGPLLGPPSPAPPQDPAPPIPPPQDAEAGLPEWLTVEGHLRLRYEAIDRQLGAGTVGNSRSLFTRWGVAATANVDPIEATLEILDGRAFDTPVEQRLSTGEVNSLDILQLYVGTRTEDALRDGDRLAVTLGRQTIDIGSRRFVARNRFRNTINAFTGAHVLWTGDSGGRVEAFYTTPVRRLPRDQMSIRDNDQDFDEERTQVRFWGLHASKTDAVGDVNAELYVFGLAEEDGVNLATRNRDHVTVGARLKKPPAPGAIVFEVEAAHQTGESRATTASADTTDLDVSARMLHLSGGYQWDARLKPRLEATFDHASGDDDPTDGKWNRLDTLFGARPFDFGATGLLSAFSRANIQSFGLRLNLVPGETTQLMIADRFFRLDESRDAWAATGLVDPTGASGDDLGNLLELRLRWQARPDLRVTFAASHLFAGDFEKTAPGALVNGDATYGWVETHFTF